MIIPRWSTIGLFVVVVMQFTLSWLHAKKTGKTFREAVLPSALLAVSVSIIFARECFGDLPLWIDAPIAILSSLIILAVAGLAAVEVKRYLKDAWRLENKKDK
jgi:protein-S-isoprenylcysteine O-methyltransferase Ste14